MYTHPKQLYSKGHFKSSFPHHPLSSPSKVGEERKRAGQRFRYLVIDVFPVIQSNQLKRGKHRPQKIIEVRIAVVWIWANAEADVTLVAVPGKAKFLRR